MLNLANVCKSMQLMIFSLKYYQYTFPKNAELLSCTEITKYAKKSPFKKSFECLIQKKCDQEEYHFFQIFFQCPVIFRKLWPTGIQL